MNDLKKILFILFVIISINANAQYSDLIVRRSPIFDIIRAEILETPNNNLLTALKNNSVKKVLCYNETINKIFFTIDVKRNGLPEKYYEYDSTQKEAATTIIMEYDSDNNVRSYLSYNNVYGNENYNYHYKNGLLSSIKIHSDENSLDSVFFTRNAENKISSAKIFKIEGRTILYDINRGITGRVDSVNIGNDIVYFCLKTEDNIEVIIDINMNGACFFITNGKTQREFYFNGKHADQKYLELLNSIGSSNSFNTLPQEELMSLAQALKINFFTIDYIENGLPKSVDCIYGRKSPAKLIYSYEYYEN